MAMLAMGRSVLRSEVTMFRGRRVVVVMPAYNAAKTLCQTYAEVMALVMVVESNAP